MQGEILFYFIILTFQSLQSNQVHNLPATFHISLKCTCSTHLISRCAHQTGVIRTTYPIMHLGLARGSKVCTLKYDRPSMNSSSSQDRA